MNSEIVAGNILQLFFYAEWRVVGAIDEDTFSAHHLLKYGQLIVGTVGAAIDVIF
jgi:hypothetical protein